MQVQYRRRESILIKLQVGTYNLPGYIGICYVGVMLVHAIWQVRLVPLIRIYDYENVVDRTYNMFVLMFELVWYNK